MFILLAMAALLAGCVKIPTVQRLKDLEFKLTDMKVSSSNIKKSNFRMDLEVLNTNAENVHMGRFEFTLYADDKKLFSGKTTEPLDLLPSERKPYTVKVSIDHLSSGKMVLDFIEGKKLKERSYEIRATYHLVTLVGEIPISFTVKDETIKKHLVKD